MSPLLEPLNKKHEVTIINTDFFLAISTLNFGDLALPVDIIILVKV